MTVFLLDTYLIALSLNVSDPCCLQFIDILCTICNKLNIEPNFNTFQGQLMCILDLWGMEEYEKMYLQMTFISQANVIKTIILSSSHLMLLSKESPVYYKRA